jgi:hypothetical protein
MLPQQQQQQQWPRFRAQHLRVQACWCAGHAALHCGLYLLLINMSCCLCPLPTAWSCSIDVRISQQQSRPPLGGAMAGWEIAGMSTSPFAGEVGDVTVEFGELLGSVSFGRVNKAR